LRVRMSKLSGTRANAFWYNPRTSRWYVPRKKGAKKIPFAAGIPSGLGAPDRDFVPPGQGPGHDWVLVLERSAPAHRVVSA
jgi:collagenase-like protein with putative collagen-binding domain